MLSGDQSVVRWFAFFDAMRREGKKKGLLSVTAPVFESISLAE